jgi:hypothetical protein
LRPASLPAKLPDFFAFDFFRGDGGGGPKGSTGSPGSDRFRGIFFFLLSEMEFILNEDEKQQQGGWLTGVVRETFREVSKNYLPT